jgi:hypothetical protein
VSAFQRGEWRQRGVEKVIGKSSINFCSCVSLCIRIIYHVSAIPSSLVHMSSYHWFYFDHQSSQALLHSTIHAQYFGVMDGTRIILINVHIALIHPLFPLHRLTLPSSLFTSQTYSRTFALLTITHKILPSPYESIKMKLFFQHIVLLLPLLPSLVLAHMSLKYPPQFQTPWNEKATTVDPNHRDPIIRRSFPCKLAHVGMTEEDSVVEWKAGSMQKIEVIGTALHM